MDETFIIELFDKKKLRIDHFDCGEILLNNFIFCYASQQQKKGLGRTFALVNQQRHLIGFYTLSAGSVRYEDAPETLKQKLPRYPIPTVVLGRLAVDKRYQGKGCGKQLLKDALLRVAAASDTIGMVAVIVEAKNEQALSFYKQYGFIPFLNISRKLFLPLKTIKTALSID